MRVIRGAKSLSTYFDSLNCPISESTIYRLIKQNSIPYKKPSPGILIFDLNAIDNWLLESPGTE